MPSYLHEALVELFRHRPSLAAELLADPLGIEVPAHQQVRLESGELGDLSPTEYRADAVVTLSGGGAPVLAVVVEAQLRRDDDKRRSWPVYVATLHARLGCPVMLLVVCPDPATAGWCGTPIVLGHPGFVLTPLVLGPDRVPVVIDEGRAGRSPELAVLSAMAHGSHPRRDLILQALLAALESVDRDHANLYADVVLAALPEAARHHLEELMAIRTYEYQSDFARRYYGQGRAEGEAKGRAEGEAKGKAEGEAKAVLAFLAARGIEVPNDAYERITDCTDLEQLDIWIRRAATAASVQDLFD